MNLLVDPLFRVQTRRGLERLSLPALFAALGEDTVEHYPGIQRHQEDAFHVFLCYLAGAALSRSGTWDPRQPEEFWREGLRTLAGDAADDAWSLVVEDLSRPAFLQPPLPPADHSKLKQKSKTPDELDLLVTAKNHDLKQTRAHRAELDEWIYALISLQTMAGYSGRGNHGISRMNSGYGNRPIVELIRSHRPGRRWQDAIDRLADHRRRVLAGPWGYDPHGLVLVWIEPWDGRAQLSLDQLDPFYVEICRRVRFRQDGETLRVEAVPTYATRIYTDLLGGNVGDAWLPIDRGREKDPQALTVGPVGVTVDLLRRLLFEDALELTPLHRPGSDWEASQGLWLSVSVLVRGEGKTEGFYSRLVFIPPSSVAPIRSFLFTASPGQELLATLSRTWIEFAGTMRERVLKPAVFLYLEGAPVTRERNRDSARTWWTRAARRFDRLWEDEYFDFLWSVRNPEDRVAEERRWAERLRDLALKILDEVEQAFPQHVGRRWRARVRSRQMFWGSLRKQFPLLFPEEEESA